EVEPEGAAVGGEDDFEGEEGAAAAFGGDEVEYVGGPGVVAGEAVGVAVGEFFDRLDARKELLGEEVAAGGHLALAQEAGDGLVGRRFVVGHSLLLSRRAGCAMLRAYDFKRT